MTAFIARLLFTPFKPIFDYADRRCAEMKAQALADAQQAPDFIEPPEPEPDAPIYDRLTLEYMAAAMAWADLDNDTIAAQIEEWSHG